MGLRCISDPGKCSRAHPPRLVTHFSAIVAFESWANESQARNGRQDVLCPLNPSDRGSAVPGLGLASQLAAPRELRSPSLLDFAWLPLV